MTSQSERFTRGSLSVQVRFASIPVVHTFTPHFCHYLFSQRADTTEELFPTSHAHTRTRMSGFAKFLRFYSDREPVVVASCALGAVAIALPLVVVPVRRSLGLPTDQYDGPKIPEAFRKSRGYLEKTE